MNGLLTYSFQIYDFISINNVICMYIKLNVLIILIFKPKYIDSLKLNS